MIRPSFSFPLVSDAGPAWRFLALDRAFFDRENAHRARRSIEYAPQEDSRERVERERAANQMG